MRVTKEIHDRVQGTLCELSEHYRTVDALRTQIAVEVATRKMRFPNKSTREIWKQVSQEFVQ